MGIIFFQEKIGFPDSHKVNIIIDKIAALILFIVLVVLSTLLILNSLKSQQVSLELENAWVIIQKLILHVNIAIFVLFEQITNLIYVKILT